MSSTQKESPVLCFGTVPFSVGQAAFTELERSSEYAWSAQSRVGNDPALQFTGYGEDTITLPCIVCPGAEMGGSVDALSTLRLIADAGEPRILVDSKGTDHGTWIITSIAEKHTRFLPSGAARKIDFTLTLKRYARRTQ